MLRRQNKDSQQLWRWVEYEQVEPFGELREDYRAALIAREVANTSPHIKYRRQPKDKVFTVEEMLLTFGGDKLKPVKQTPEEQVAILKIWAQTLAAGS